MSEFVIDFDVIFNDFIAANQKQWAHDRGSTVGASEVFGCLRKNWYEKRGKEKGVKPDEEYAEDWGALTRGNLIENHHVVPALRDHMPDGVTVLYTGDDQETLVLDRSSATPDGLITGLPKNCSLRVKGGTQDIIIPDIKSDCVVLEIKSIDPRATLQEERAKHHGQTQVQLGLFHDLTKFRPYYSIVLYIDASFLSKVTPFIVEYDPNIYREARARANDVWEIDDPMSIMPEGRFSGDCKHCKWRTACGTATVSAIPKYETELTAESEAKLESLVLDYEQKKADAEKSLRAKEIAAEMIKEFLSGTNSRKVRTERWSVNWYGTKSPSRVDTKAMEADGIDLEPYRREGTPYDVLRVTPRTEKTKKD